MFNDISFVRRVSQIGTRLTIRLFGEQVGEDPLGNRYFRSRRSKEFGRESRWVLYKGEPEASLVPPDWFGWLHHTCDQPLPSDGESLYVWQKPHQPNLSATGAAPLPLGHPASAVGLPSCDGVNKYQSWAPPE